MTDIPADGPTNGKASLLSFPPRADLRLVPGAPGAKPRLQPDADLIHMLERLLEHARSGELTALAVAAVYTDAELQVPDSLINAGWATTPGTSFAVGAAIAKLDRAWGIHADSQCCVLASSPA